MRARGATSLLLGVPLLLGGCESIDPLTRPGVWHPVGANDATLAVMIAQPSELASGTAAPLADGAVAAAAVARYRAGKVKRLPQSGLAKITLSGSAAGAAAEGE